MVCYCSWLANDPSVPPKKKCTSSGKRRPCAKLWAIRPPSPCAQVLMLAVTRKGSFSSLKVICQPIYGQEKDVMLDSTWAVGPVSLVGSQILIPPDTRGGEVLKRASPETLGGCSVMHCLFRERLRGGGGEVGLFPWGCCYCVTGRASGKKWSMVTICLTTISSSP